VPSPWVTRARLFRTQGHVDWLEKQLAADVNPAWLAVYQAERAHLAKLGQQLLDLGFDPESERVRDIIYRNLTGSARPTAPPQPVAAGPAVLLVPEEF
jgi:hypothetical protein